MLYDRKILKETFNKFDIELTGIEYKASVYDEIENYLSENKCSEAVRLVNKVKEEINNFVITLKNDLDEIENICIELSKIIKNLYIEKKEIESNIVINNKNIFISKKDSRYSFIYSIGFDEYKMQYRYGIVKGNINKGKFYNVKSKIGFSNDSNLERYADFKHYFKSILNDFHNCNSIESLDFLNANIIKELSQLFYTDNLTKYCIKNSEKIYELTGIKGIEITQKLYDVYDINRIKLKLLSYGYSIDDERLIHLIRSRQLCINLLDKMKTLDNVYDEDINDIYVDSIKQESHYVKFLMKELNISSEKLEIVINKVNSTTLK